jgi:glutamyl-tRNA synthetase
MTNEVRVRFAPSPTGYLHVGGARTALFNWLFAKRYGGVFILRVEDTDIERSSEEMVRAITEGLEWLGISWDKGPYLQSSRIEQHREFATILLEKKAAYRCFCPKKRIEMERKAAEDKGETYIYQGTCRGLKDDEIRENLDSGEPFVIRLNVPHGSTSFHDEVYGDVTVDNSTLGDFILLRSDGCPTYHLAVVADDREMGITHVIRGEDHRANTPKHILIYQAMEWPVPIFAHLPLILGEDKKRLSKRHGAASVGSYREEGFLPEALFNFLALLGWSPGDDREIMSCKEIVDAFSLERIIKRSAIFDPTKLEWMNGQYFSTCSPDRLVELVNPILEEAGLFDKRFLDEEMEWYRKILMMLRDRAHRLGDFVIYGRPFFTDDFDYDPEAVSKRWKSSQTIDYLKSSRATFFGLDEFTKDKIETAIRNLAEERDLSAAKFIHPIRVAVTGKAIGPGLFELLELVGQERTVERIDRAITYLNSHPEVMQGPPD